MADDGISRVPCNMFPCVHEVYDRAKSAHISRWRCARCCLPYI